MPIIGYHIVLRKKGKQTLTYFIFSFILRANR